MIASDAKERIYVVSFIRGNEYRTVESFEEALSHLIDELIKDGSIIVKIKLK